MDETGPTGPPDDPRPPPLVAAVSRLGTLPTPGRAAQIAIALVGLGLIAAASVIGARFADVSQLSNVGYPGVFLLSLLGSAALVLPVPGLVSLCAVSVVLNPLALGLLAAAGETLGEISGYAIGYGGGGVVEKSGTYQRVRRWMIARGWFVILVVSIVPNPLFDLVGIAAGATRYPMLRFLGIVLVGKAIKGVTLAYLCHHGIRALPWVG